MIMTIKQAYILAVVVVIFVVFVVCFPFLLSTYNDFFDIGSSESKSNDLTDSMVELESQNNLVLPSNENIETDEIESKDGVVVDTENNLSSNINPDNVVETNNVDNSTKIDGPRGDYEATKGAYSREII